MNKKTFTIEYKVKDSLPVRIPLEFKYFKTEVSGADQDEAEKYFERFFPLAQIVSITETQLIEA